MVFDTWPFGWMYQRDMQAQPRLAFISLSLEVTHIISIYRPWDGTSHKAPPYFQGIRKHHPVSAQEGEESQVCARTRNLPHLRQCLNLLMPLNICFFSPNKTEGPMVEPHMYFFFKSQNNCINAL